LAKRKSKSFILKNFNSSLCLLIRERERERFIFSMNEKNDSKKIELKKKFLWNSSFWRFKNKPLKIFFVPPPKILDNLKYMKELPGFTKAFLFERLLVKRFERPRTLFFLSKGFSTKIHQILF